MRPPQPDDLEQIRWSVEDEEPVWRTHKGESIPLSQIEDGHLRRIERFLRGDGYLKVNAFSEHARHWYMIVATEMVRRGLEALPPYEPRS